MNHLNMTTKQQVLTIKNTVAEISRMSDWLIAALINYGITKQVKFRLDLCANEAVTNIVSYAFPDHALHEINLSLAIDNESVSLLIEDDGIAFNPLIMPRHAVPDSLEEAKIGGLGIDLIRHYIDDFSYQRTGNKNMLSLIIKR